MSESVFSPSRIKIEVSNVELYDIQLRNPSLDLLIKILLRSYGGLFDDFVKIDEFDIARKLNNTKDNIEKQLDYLANSNVISYVKQSNLPQLTYLQARVEAKSIYISKQHYSERKSVSVQKMESVIYYAFSKHKCRSQLLLSYFGEKNEFRCGVCDVCLERNKLELSDIEFTNISDQIKKILNQTPLNMSDLISKIEISREDKIIKVIQWLTENGKLIINKENLLEWRK